MRIEKGKVRWMAYDEYSDEIWWAASEEEAMQLAQKMLDSYSDYDRIIPEHIMNGGVIVAKITAESAFKITDRQSNYDNPNDWPYDDVDEVGDLYMKKVEE
jgi:hypothetical protein